MNTPKLPFGSAKPDLARTSDMKIDGMPAVQRVNQTPDNYAKTMPTEMLKAGMKDLAPQIPVKK